MNLTKPQKLLAHGQLDAAEIALPTRSESTDPRIEIIRARVEAARGDNHQAIKVLEDARQRFPDHAPTSLFLGTYLWDVASIEDAAAAFSEVLARQKENDLARSYMSLCHFALGNREAAANVWKEFGFSDNTMFRIRAAEFIERSWLQDGSYMGERPLPSGNVSAVKLKTSKALALFYKRDFSGLQGYLPEPPLNDDLGAFLAATSCEMLGDYSRATAYLEPLKGRRPEWPDPLVALHGRLLTRRGRLKEAAEQFSKVLVVGPEDFGVNYYLGIICMAYEKHREARQYFLRAFTSYMVDTREFQWWQLEQVLLSTRGYQVLSRSGANE